jgi:hypothetical protein
VGTPVICPVPVGDSNIVSVKVDESDSPPVCVRIAVAGLEEVDGWYVSKHRLVESPTFDKLVISNVMLDEYVFELLHGFVTVA